ncbi:MAG TPA: hypothetical protein EYP09_06010 [Anaerolineae bacterium]|nr:hypothetical protein [Anaerolineae bacterium]
MRQLRNVLIALLFCLPIACWPGPPPSELTYFAPYEVAIEAGSDLPGTGIRYVGLSDRRAELLIDGRRTLKQKGDSLDWEGSPAEGTSVDLSLRILWYTAEKLHVAGTAKVRVSNPTPQVAPIPTEAATQYSNAPVAYSVARGKYIPGTLVKYLGKEKEGAHLEGVEGHPYRKIADSIVWEGKLRENVYLRLNLRVLFITEDSLRVGGMATIWIAP